MKLTRGRINLKPWPQGCVITLGNFDGVHLGHQAVLAQTARAGEQRNLPVVAITFEPLPREFFAPHAPVARLTRLRERYLFIKRLGLLDELAVLHFDRALANMSADDFVQSILVKKLNARHIVIGDDFRFGTKRRGDFGLLERLGQKWGFTVEAADTFMLEGVRVSSTKVRMALNRGDMDEAASLLGRPFTLCGHVAHGDERGRQLGFPTANVALQRRQSPLHGVYVVETARLQTHTLHYGVANVGSRPTVGGTRARLEVHLFDFHGSLYGEVLEVRFLHHIRDERRFESLPSLIAQIKTDVQVARDWLAKHNLS